MIIEALFHKKVILRLMPIFPQFMTLLSLVLWWFLTLSLFFFFFFVYHSFFAFSICFLFHLYACTYDKVTIFMQINHLAFLYSCVPIIIQEQNLHFALPYFTRNCNHLSANSQYFISTNQGIKSMPPKV